MERGGRRDHEKRRGPPRRKAPRPGRRDGGPMLNKSKHFRNAGHMSVSQPTRHAKCCRATREGDHHAIDEDLRGCPVTRLAPHTPASSEPQIDPIAQDWPTLDELGRRYTQRVLVHTQGNKTKAAEVLQIDRRTLNRRLARDRRRAAMMLATKVRSQK